MILIDTSIWIDHLHKEDPRLVESLSRSLVAQHPMIIGELALGTLRDRGPFLELLARLPTTEVAMHDDVMRLVDDHQLYGRGLSLVDAHLLAAVRLTPGTRLLTRDKQLAEAARGMGVAVRV